MRDDLDLFFASRDGARARAYAARFQGCGAFGSYAAAAADPRVEAMYLCTPHHLHQAHVALAAQAGKHILVEKPLARTLAEGRAMIAAAQRAGVTLMVAENARFMAAVRQCNTISNEYLCILLQGRYRCVEVSLWVAHLFIRFGISQTTVVIVEQLFET